MPANSSAPSNRGLISGGVIESGQSVFLEHPLRTRLACFIIRDLLVEKSAWHELTVAPGEYVRPI
jgi:hypothetical protein